MSWFPTRSLMTVVLAVVFGYVIVEAIGQPLQAKLFPITIGTIGLAVVLVQLFRELREGVALARGADARDTAPDDGSGNADFTITDAEKTREGRLRAVEQFGWVGGLLLGLWWLGFYLAVPLMVALYLLRHREPPLLIALLTAGIALAVWGVFDNLLHLPFPEGQLFVWLGI